MRIEALERVGDGVIDVHGLALGTQFQAAVRAEYRIEVRDRPRGGDRRSTRSYRRLCGRWAGRLGVVGTGGDGETSGDALEDGGGVGL